MNRPTTKLKIAVLSRCAVQWLSHFALLVIWIYRAAVSPVLLAVLGPRCRFEPTCSKFAAEAIGRYGIVQGGLMALKRLIKCRPFGDWGPDPVPVIDFCRRIDLGERRVSSQ